MVSYKPKEVEVFQPPLHFYVIPKRHALHPYSSPTSTHPHITTIRQEAFISYPIHQKTKQSPISAEGGLYV